MGANTSSESDRLHQVGDGTKNSVLPLYKMTGDAELIPDLRTKSAELAKAVEEHFGKKPDFATGLTRGGLATTQAFRDVWTGAPVEVTFDGGWKDRAEEPIPEALRDPKTAAQENSLLVIGDAIVATGRSIISMLRMVAAENYTNVAVVTPIVTQLGIDTILAAFPNAHIFYAHIEEKTEWVELDIGGGKTKRVLFVGDGMGDFGDMTLESAEAILADDPEAFADATILRLLAEMEVAPAPLATAAN